MDTSIIEKKIADLQSSKNEIDNLINQLNDELIDNKLQETKRELDLCLGKTCKVKTIGDSELIGTVTDFKVSYDEFFKINVIEVKLENWTPSSIESDDNDGWFWNVTVSVIE